MKKEIECIFLDGSEFIEFEGKTIINNRNILVFSYNNIYFALSGPYLVSKKSIDEALRIIDIFQPEAILTSLDLNLISDNNIAQNVRTMCHIDPIELLKSDSKLELMSINQTIKTLSNVSTCMINHKYLYQKDIILGIPNIAPLLINFYSEHTQS